MQIPNAAWSKGTTGWANKIRQTLGPRRWRLYLAACCRELFGNKPRKDVLQAFDITDRFADTGKTKAALAKARSLGYENPNADPPDTTLDNFDLEYLGNSSELLEELFNPTLKNELLPRMGMSAQWDLRMKFPASRAMLQRVLAEFEAPANAAKRFDPAWRTSDVLGLARGIYRDRAFDRMPILSDALMDAGCADKEMLAHCRAKTPHVRGCWVLDLILDDRWDEVWSDEKPKEKAKKGTKTPPAPPGSPFTIKPAIAREIDETMGTEAKWPAADTIARTYAENKKYRKTAVKNVMQYVGYSAAQAEASVAFDCLSAQVDWRRRAIARRVRLDDPRELAENVTIEARSNWFAYGNHEAEREQHRLHSLALAVAVHDRVLERRILESSPVPIQDGDPDTVCDYNATIAVLRGDLDSFRKLFPYKAKRKTGNYLYEYTSRRCLQAVAEDNPDLFRTSLEECLNLHRKIMGMVQLIDIFAHATYELCRRANPKVVATFDVNHAPPWDAAFHRWIQGCDDPLKEFDWKKIPDEIREGLKDMTRPIWWDAVPPADDDDE
jgi:hypothetical protein